MPLSLMLQRWEYPDVALDVQQLANLTKELQKIALDAGFAHPLLIGIDQENGMVRMTPPPPTHPLTRPPPSPPAMFL